MVAEGAEHRIGTKDLDRDPFDVWGREQAIEDLHSSLGFAYKGVFIHDLMGLELWRDRERDFWIE